MSATAAPAPASPTAVFIRLKLTLLRNGVRQSPGRTVGYIASAFMGLVVAGLAVLGLIALRGTPHAGALAALLIGILTLGWAVMPLFFPTGDETLDPTRLVMLPLRPRPLIRALLVVSLIGIGPVVTLAVATGAVISVASGAVAAVVGVAAVVLVVLVCVTLARSVATASVRLLTSRRGRDLAVLGGLFIALGAQGFNLAVQRLGHPENLPVLESLGSALRWVPPASAISAVDDAGHGAYGRAAAGLALTALALALVLWWWQRTLTTLMTAPDSSTLQAVEKDGARRADAGGRGLARLLPQGRTGTVMLRTLRYAWRDPKAKMSWTTSLGFGLLMPVLWSVQGNRSIYTVLWAAGMLGSQMSNQFGQDNSAFWMVASTIATARDAYEELKARALAVALVAVPYVTLVTVAAAAFMGPWSAFPEVYGLSLALFGALVATGAMASVLSPYSIPSEGNKNIAAGQGSLVWSSFLIGVLAAGALIAPLLALTIVLHMADLHGLLWIVLPAGAVYGLGVAALGLRLAAPRAAGRLPEILAAVSKG
ncbi:hypothetical protein [Streptomyces sp. CT34]|uniref:hypothetical protein n=1 Tax=Streptomyces sp. CT34 TaxID=1553907 RepID=UPI0005BADD86|nr:hypothetical protein [Streptomyces sp. CT34]